MKILYGVQATGNGHISRARGMAPKLKAAGIEVQYLFSGRPKDQFFSMEPFGDYWWREGLTFQTEAGQIRYLRTVIKSAPLTFINDIRKLDLSEFDLILTDFEPITAWAAKLAKIPCIGMGHQYAFHFDIPTEGDYFLPSIIMKWMAPCDQSLGLHWWHYDYPILPPIADVHDNNTAIVDNKVLVYLLFDELAAIKNLLKPFDDYDFYIYTSIKHPIDEGHIHLRPFSRDGFQHDLASAAYVICGAGFELVSEALQIGKKILVKPVKGQMEQLSNAKTLRDLGLAQSMKQLDQNTVRDWLKNAKHSQVVYPDVAEAIAQWLRSGRKASPADLSKSLWAKTETESAL